jgi:signal transduction histidine kinase
VIRTTIEILSPDLRDKNQRLTVALEAAEYRLHGDSKRLLQVFTNLLRNASKFAPVHGEISARARNEFNKPA